MNKRGRPKNVEDFVPQIKYSTIYENQSKEKHIWNFDQNISTNGPISVEFTSPQFTISEKLLREFELLEKKYEIKVGGRKPRITKDDKQRMEQIEKELEEFHYSLYPEDRPKVKIRKSKK